MFNANRIRTTAVAIALLAGSPAIGQDSQYFEGFSHPFRSAEVASATSGIVKSWLVIEGESVKAGQSMVQLDDTIHQTNVAIARAAIASRGELALAHAELKLRNQRLNAIKELSKQRHATADELMRAQTEREVAAARLLAAEESQLRRELELEKLLAHSKSFTVVAPYDGVVTKINRLAGEYVGPAEPVVCEVAELETLAARFLVPTEAVETLPNESVVEVQFMGLGIKVSGVATVSPYPDAETGMRSIAVKIDNPRGELPAGVRCRLQLGKALHEASSKLSAMTPSSH